MQLMPAMIDCLRLPNFSGMFCFVDFQKLKNTINVAAQHNGWVPGKFLEMFLYRGLLLLEVVNRVNFEQDYN